MIVVIENKILILFYVHPPISVNMCIVLVYFILHLFYDVFVDLEARTTTASELG